MAKSDKLPALQFYPGDWRKDPGVQALDYFCRGVWFEILLLMHESEERGALLLNGNPMPEDALARLLGLDKQILSNTLTTLLSYGVASIRAVDGCLICRRMVRDEELRQIRIKAGSLGGNPILVNQKSTTQDNQIPTPSSSSSSSSSSSNNKGSGVSSRSRKISHKAKLRELREPILQSISDGELNKALRGWCDWRENEQPARKPVTPQALKQTLRKYQNRGADLLNDIRFSVSKDWVGIFPERKPFHASNSESNKNGTISKRGMNFVSMAMPKVNG